ncbi:MULTISPECIES: radical SAM protein [Blautia]|uniref:radical SAM protein n=1 Tax=Blautia TaxID=572511 RepID=UPI000BA2F55B|nr:MULTISPECIES: radical SAM protein [Blautia]
MEYGFETGKEYSRWHHLAAYNSDGVLIEFSPWIDPVHIHGMPLEDVYINPMRENIINKVVLPYSYVQVGPTNSCNLACKGCYSANNRSRDTLKYENIEKVIYGVYEDIRVKGVSTAMIAFHGPGDPLCNKETRTTVLKAIRLCSKLGLCTRITTNATFLDDEYWEQLIAEKSLKLIWVSMKAGTQESYLAYTGRDLFDASRHNMDIMVRERLKSKRHDLVLKSSTEISKYSIYETYYAAEYSKRIGFDIFKPALHSIDFNKVYTENTILVQQLRENLKNLYDDNFNSLYWEIPQKCSINYHADKFPAKYCYQAETRLYFDGKGKISPCIHWLDNPNDEYYLGDICLFDKKYKGFSDESDINKKNLSCKLKSCAGCSDPWVNYFHDWIRSILQIDIHANFVKVFDKDIKKNYSNLLSEDVLEGYDPRSKYYD